MKALSLWQPWASLIVHGEKDVENRTWPTRFRGRLVIHASKTADESDFTDPWIADRLSPSAASWIQPMGGLANAPRGALVGEVTVIDCVTRSESRWYQQGSYGFVLVDPVAYKHPIPLPGTPRLI